MRKNMALSKIQHHGTRLWIHNQAYILCKRGTTFRENRNPTPMKSSTCTDEARFTVQVGPKEKRHVGFYNQNQLSQDGCYASIPRDGRKRLRASQGSFREDERRHG